MDPLVYEIFVFVVEQLDQRFVDELNLPVEVETAIYHCQSYFIDEAVLLVGLNPKRPHVEHVLQYRVALI